VFDVLCTHIHLTEIHDETGSQTLLAIFFILAYSPSTKISQVVTCQILDNSDY